MIYNTWHEVINGWKGWKNLQKTGSAEEPEFCRYEGCEEWLNSSWVTVNPNLALEGKMFNDL